MAHSDGIRNRVWVVGQAPRNVFQSTCPRWVELFGPAIAGSVAEPPEFIPVELLDTRLTLGSRVQGSSTVAGLLPPATVLLSATDKEFNEFQRRPSHRISK